MNTINFFLIETFLISTLFPAFLPFTVRDRLTDQFLVGSQEKITYLVPKCDKKKYWTHCSDDTLKIQFDYPSDWGVISAFYRPGGISGNVYWYQFSGKNEKGMYVYAGGRSFDFSEGRDMTLTDFSGYSPNNLPPCEITNLSFCKKIKSNITLEVLPRKGEDLCGPLPGTRFPVVVLRINLPNNKNINGFTIVGNFLSRQEIDRYGTLLDSGTPIACDQMSITAYNLKVEELSRNVNLGRIDDESKKNLKQMIQLAKSVKFK